MWLQITVLARLDQLVEGRELILDLRHGHLGLSFGLALQKGRCTQSCAAGEHQGIGGLDVDLALAKLSRDPER